MVGSHTWPSLLAPSPSNSSDGEHQTSQSYQKVSFLLPDGHHPAHSSFTIIRLKNSNSVHEMQAKLGKQLYRWFWGDDTRRFTCTCAASQIALRPFNLRKSRFTLPPPDGWSPSFQSLTVCQTWGSICLRRWEPKVLFLKCGSWRIACNSTPSPPARGYRRGKEWGTGVVLIGVCSDDIFPTSEWQRNFIQVCPSRILGYIDTTPGGNNLCWVKYRHAG